MTEPQLDADLIALWAITPPMLALAVLVLAGVLLAIICWRTHDATD